MRLNFISFPSIIIIVRRRALPSISKGFRFLLVQHIEKESEKDRSREIDEDDEKSDFCAYIQKKVLLEFFSTLKFFFQIRMEKRTNKQLITHTNTFETSLNLFQYSFFFHFHLLMYLLGLTNNIIWVTQERERRMERELNDIYICHTNTHTHGHTYTQTVWYIMRCRANVCVLLWLLNDVQMFNILCF